MVISSWLSNGLKSLCSRRPKARSNRTGTRFQNVEQVEERVVLSGISCAQSHLDALVNAINSELSEAESNSDSFFNSLSSSTSAPFIGSPLAPVTSQLSGITAGTIGNLQSTVNTNVGAVQSGLSGLDSYFQTLINTPVGATFNAGGGVWNVQSYPGMGWWGADYNLNTPEGNIQFQTDSSGWATLTGDRTTTSMSGPNSVFQSIFANVTRDSMGSVFGDVGISHNSDSTADETYRHFSVNSTFNNDPVSGGDDSLYFSYADRGVDSYFNIGGYGTSGTGGNVLGFGNLTAERVTTNSAFGLNANLSSNGLDDLDSSYRHLFTNGEINTRVTYGPLGLYSSSSINVATPNGVLGANVITTPTGTYGGYTMISEAPGVLFVHSSGTFGPGVINLGGTVTLPIITPNHNILFNGTLNYMDDPRWNDPVWTGAAGLQWNVLDHGALQFNWMTIPPGGSFSGMQPGNFFFLNGVFTY